MPRDKTTKVILNGGLGNQLFQVAAGLYLSGNERVIVDEKLGRPNLNFKGKAVLNSIAFPGNTVVFAEGRKKNLQSLMFRILLVAGTQTIKYPILNSFIRKIADITGFLSFTGVRRILVCEGIGYTSGLKRSQNSVIVGYFQSYKYASDKDVFRVLQAIGPVKLGDELRAYSELAKTVRPICVHIRLGDYLSEPNFGLLPPSYFLKGISILREKEPQRPIWFFSDEVSRAREYFRGIELGEVTWISDVDNDPVSTFELMRSGSGYVISNSTFSWWAAFLRKDSSALVIAPYPWFKELDTPEELLPESWILLHPWSLS